jgi:putative ABC transport system permease protein
MGSWRQIWAGLRALSKRDVADRDIADEVRHYMEEAERQLMADGASPEEARRRVRLEYGDAGQVREDVRAYGWENAADSMVIDLRYAARRLRRSPGFTTAAVLTLGLGIGAATAIFSAVSTALFEPLPYPHADRLLAIADRSIDGSPIPVTFGTYRELSERSRSFEALAVSRAWQPTVTGRGEPERIEAARVSADYFRVLGVEPFMGRGFTGDEDRVGGPQVVILSDELWRRSFGGASAIVGHEVRLDDRPFIVVGVMPPAFESPPGRAAEVWAPLQYDATLPSFEGREWGHHLDLTARLRADADIQTARDELARIAAQPVPEIIRPGWSSLDQGFVVLGMKAAATEGTRPVLLALLGAVLLLLGIACVNVTNLVLARGARRRGELAMRTALGAPRARLIRQLLTESILLAAVGGALGVVLARLGLGALAAMDSQGIMGTGRVGVSGAALLFAVGVTTLVGLTVGLAPVVQGADGALHNGGQRTVGSHGGVRRTLVMAEVALALVLLVGAGLVLQSVRHLFAVPPGFDASGVVVMQIHAAPGRFPSENELHRFFREALDAVRGVPGVAAAALTSQLPLAGQADIYGINFLDDTRPSEVDRGAFRYTVTPGYLDEVMRVPLVRGRTLNEGDDAGSPRVVVVNEAFAKRAFPTGDALGRRIRMGRADQPESTIVGVVADVKQTSLGAPDQDAFYVTTEQWYFTDAARWLVVRTNGDGTQLVPSIKRAIWSVDADQAVVRAASMESLVAGSEAQRRFALRLLEVFAAMALLLAGIGLYGVLAGSVADRRREIGVRAALGATGSSLVALVVREGVALTAVGAVVGVAGAITASGALSSLLFGVSRVDPPTYVVVVCVVLVVCGVACWLPAARAARVDPVTTLRVD